MFLSLCMIVKNEENYLRKCLESVKNIVDEMIIVDTGSVDGTVAIAESLGAKVFNFPWNGSFSDARNYSLKHAKGDWIMIMDADEELEKCKPDEIRELMNETDADAYFFETISYLGDEVGCDVVKNMNLRLLKNKKGYFYCNPIHEQIYGSIIAANPSAKFINKSYKVYHYGYLNKSINEKNKRERNMSLLEKELKKVPGYTFNLYNLGSEYCAMENYKKALELFEKAYQNFIPQEGFGPVMMFKMANCYLELERHEEALKLCDAGLAYYPLFTDLEYMKGIIYGETGNNAMAARHFKRCCEMGEAPNYLNIIVGTGTYRPLFSLGEIYFEWEDYEAAANSFKQSFLENPDYQEAFMLLVKTYCRMKLDDEKLECNIEEYREKIPARYDCVIAEQLIKEKYFDEALIYAEKYEKNFKESGYASYLKGLCRLYQKKYEEAYTLFSMILGDPEYGIKAAAMQVLCLIFTDEYEKAQMHLQKYSQGGQKWIETCLLLTSIVRSGEACMLSEDEKELIIGILFCNNNA